MRVGGALLILVYWWLSSWCSCGLFVLHSEGVKVNDCCYISQEKCLCLLLIFMLCVMCRLFSQHCLFIYLDCDAFPSLCFPLIISRYSIAPVASTSSSTSTATSTPSAMLAPLPATVVPE